MRPLSPVNTQAENRYFLTHVGTGPQNYTQPKFRIPESEQPPTFKPEQQCAINSAVSAPLPLPYTRTGTNLCTLAA
jgi:hypothetical protein